MRSVSAPAPAAPSPPDEPAPGGATRAEALDALAREIIRVAAEIDARMERWLRLVVDFDRLGGARDLGFRSTAEWMACTCGVSHRAAREHVRVARELVERPRLRRELAQGILSYAKVRAITRAPAGDREDELIDLARRSTAREVEQVVRSLRSAPSSHLDVARRAHERRYLGWWWEEDGSLSFRGRLAGEAAAAFVEAIETGAAAVHPSPARSGATHAHPPVGARRADALGEIALSGSPRTQVVLHVDEAALACEATGHEPRAGEVCAFEAGPAVPSETARRLSCDGELVVAAHGADGEVDYGRRRRVVPPPLRTMLERRDQSCRFPGCWRRHGLHAHHVQHWAHGGRTERSNLILLCRFHHRLVHEEGFTVARTPGGWRFRCPDGRAVPGPGHALEEGDRAPPDP